MRRREWALLATAAAEGDPLSAVQLQKVLFLIGKDLGEHTGGGYYDFRPFHYGPYDAAVYADADRLDAEGLLAVSPSHQGRWNEYRATPQGIELAQQLFGTLPASAVDRIKALVAWARRLSFEDLLGAVYTKYPEMRVNSVFRGAMEAQRVDRPRTPEADWYARRAEHVRRQAEYDPAVRFALYQTHRARERQQCEYTTFEEIDQDYPAEA
jgi:uncharacterized protein